MVSIHTDTMLEIRIRNWSAGFLKIGVYRKFGQPNAEIVLKMANG